MFSRIAVGLALCLAATGTLAEPPKEFKASQTESVTAKVKKVDQKTRDVTLEGPDGDVTFKAGDDVKNLKQLKKGDEVTATLSSRSPFGSSPRTRSRPSWSSAPASSAHLPARSRAAGRRPR